MRQVPILLLLITTYTANTQCLSGDCANGEGTCMINKEIIYTGSFKNNLPDGRGTFKNADYIIYTGEVKHGLYNGKGTLYYENGDVYIGIFLNGMRHGEGEYRNKDGIRRNTYYYNALTESDMVSDEKNRNGIFTAYDKIEFATMSNNKVALVSADGSYSSFTVYDASTGQKLEKVTLPTLYSFDRTNLYLDFGTGFFDTAKHDWKMYNKKKSTWSDWRYLGKSAAGDAIFSQWNPGKEITTLFTLKTYDSKPKNLYQYKGGKYHTITAVSKDLSKLVTDGRIIDINKPKKEPVILHDYEGDYNARLVFTPSGDSLFLNRNSTIMIYATATGQKIGEVPKIRYKSFRCEDHSFSSDPYHILRLIGIGSSLVMVEGSFDKTDVMPLIDNERNFTAYEIYMDKEIKKMRENRQFEEREHKAYVKKMETIYGPGWNIDNGRSSLNKNQPKAPNEVKCSFCNGSGVTSNYVTGQEITQDKNSGRWYHVNLAKTGTCPLCNGTGYRKK